MLMTFLNASKILDPVMLADDTNLSFSNCNIPVLFATVNRELSKISQWFLANKLFLNVTKYLFFHKTSKKDDTPLKLTRLQINNYNIQKTPSLNFLEVLLDENLSWKDHINPLMHNAPKWLDTF